MTRKDYELIAEAFASQVSDIDMALPERERLALCKLADAIATKLQADSPRFDRSRFLLACNVI